MWLLELQEVQRGQESQPASTLKRPPKFSDPKLAYLEFLLAISAEISGEVGKLAKVSMV